MSIKPIDRFWPSDRHSVAAIRIAVAPDLAGGTLDERPRICTRSTPVNAPFSAQSEVQDLTREDQINMAQFNQAIWASVKGANTPMPAPQHTVFPASADEQAADGR